LLGSWNIRLPEDDVVSIVGISLCEAARNYDGRESTRFQTFFYYHLRGRLLREITDIVENKKITEEYSHDEYSDAVVSQKESLGFYNSSRFITESPEKMIEERQQQESFNKAFSELDVLEKEVITRHYFNGESLMDLADDLSYCRCHLSRVKSRAIAMLKKAIDSDSCDMMDNAGSKHGGASYKGGRGRRKKGQDIVGVKVISSKKINAMVLEAAQA
jgi:RNA polymerase sigma factor (sigma-70 family)